MGNRNLHNEFKEQLQPKEFKFSEAHWAKAEQMLNKVQTKGGFTRYYNGVTLFLSIVIIALLGITFTLNKKNNEPNNFIPSPEEVVSHTVPLNNNNESIPNKNQNTTPNADQKSNANLGISEERKSTATLNKSPHKNKVATVTNKMSTQNTSGQVNENSSVSKSEQNNRATNTYQKNIALSQYKTSFIDEYKGSISKKTNTGLNEENSITNENTRFSPPIVNKTEFNTQENTASNTMVENNTNSVSETNDKTDESESSPNEKAEDKKRNSSDNNTVIPPQPSRRALHQNYFRVGAELGVSAVNRSLTTHLDDCITYVNKRNGEETTPAAYNFNINFGQQINRWQWQLGIGFTNYQEDILYNNQVFIPTGVDNSYWDTQLTVNTKVDSSWAIDSIFVGHWNYDTLTTTTLDSNYVEQWDTVNTWQNDSSITSNNGNHNLSYFEIPVFFGYTFGKDKWFLDVQPGVSIGFLTGSKSSRYIKKDLSGLVPIAQQTEQFRQVIWKAHLRIGVRYSVEHWDFGIYPHYSATLNNILNTDKVYQRYQNFGVMLGAYYKF